jgi:hypothetical protein
MYRHYVSGLIIILLLGFLAMPGRGDSFITREMRKEDSRLERHSSMLKYI